MYCNRGHELDFSGPRDVIGHDHLIPHAHMPFPIGGPLNISETVRDRGLVPISNVECNALVDMTLIRPLNRGQGHSFCYQSISHIRLPIGSQ